jgi:hypothetical protein
MPRVSGVGRRCTRSGYGSDEPKSLSRPASGPARHPSSQDFDSAVGVGWTDVRVSRRGVQGVGRAVVVVVMVTEIACAIKIKVALFGIGGCATVVAQIGHTVAIFIAEATQANEKRVPVIGAILTERKPVAASDGAIRMRDGRARADRHACLLPCVARVKRAVFKL